MWIVSMLLVIAATVTSLMNVSFTPTMTEDAITMYDRVKVFSIAAQEYVDETTIPVAIVDWNTIRLHHETKGRGGYVSMSPPAGWYINGDGTKWAVCLPMNTDESTRLRSQVGEGIKWSPELYTGYASLCP